MKNIKWAFTLIELLVVITIIGILATWATATYTSQIQKARDTTRINDLKALQSWVEQYYQDTSVYPKWWKGWLTGTNTDVQDYVPKLPRDPKDHETCNSSTKCGYAYIVARDSNWMLDWAYELSTRFENNWNVLNKAANDWNNDNLRLELSVWLATLATNKVSTRNWWGTALDTSNISETIHIWSISATVKTSAITAF